MGACLEPGNLMIVTELMSQGSVYDLLHKHPVRVKPSRLIWHINLFIIFVIINELLLGTIDI
jgi:hypothetical protein